ncbi:MAG: type II secretion system F family protein [Anaerolineae bacterium]|nr:type II secretion system F family protein [Anaerolineae bacterium]
MEPITILIIAGVVLGVSILVLGMLYVFRSNEGIDERIQTYAVFDNLQSVEKTRGDRISIRRLRIRLNTLLGTLYSDELHQQLVSANWRITVTEFLLIKYGGTAVSFFLFWLLFGQIFHGIGAAMLFYIITGYYLRKSVRVRREKFQRQLVDVLALMSGAVRVGYSLMQSLDVVINEMASPASEEFRRVRREVELGLPLRRALLNLAERMRSDDLNLVVTAVNINSQVGGNLTTMLMAVTETIRERIRLLGEVRVLTSYARYSSYILSLLPFIVVAILFLLNPTYIGQLFQLNFILIIPIVALIGIILGNIWIRRLARIEV